MRTRRGFTLLEVMVAIAIAGVVALLVYGSAQAGLDSSDRIARHKAQIEAQSVMRALIAGALRHPADASSFGEAPFALEDITDASGEPRDRIHFFSRGVVAPLGGSGVWRVTLASTDAGMVFTAIPADGDTLRRVTATLAAVRGFDATVMSLAERVWMSQWISANQMPAAIALRFAGGADAMPPLVVRTDLGEMP